MKEKIMKGEFTPKSENYRIFYMIKFKHNEEIRKVRSLWELIFWLQNPEFEYEKIRIKYFDSEREKERIYITDFYDEKTNTIYEIKPKNYQYTLKDKIKGIQETKYNYMILDEDYFNRCKTKEMKEKIEKCVINPIETHIERRLKWLRKA